MNQPLLHDTSQYSPGGLVVSVTDSGGGGGYGVRFPPTPLLFFALSDTRRDSKIMYFFFTLRLKKNNKYQILNKPVVILKF